MLTPEETSAIMDRLFASRPKNLLRNMDDTRAGIGCLMNLLCQTDVPMSAGELSDAMQVSTARIAVLLKKVDAKGLIVRQASPTDARKVMISASEKGRERHAQIFGEMLSFMARVIERCGKDDFEQFIVLSERLRDAAEAEVAENGGPFMHTGRPNQKKGE